MKAYRLESVAVLIAAVVATASGAAGRVPLTGNWGAPGISLSLTPTGGHLTYDCARGTIDAPVIPDRRGRFAAPGTAERFAGGPQLADAPPPTTPARYTGRVRGHVLALAVRVAGDPKAQTYRMIEGLHVKHIRCL